MPTIAEFVTIKPGEIFRDCSTQVDYLKIKLTASREAAISLDDFTIRPFKYSEIVEFIGEMELLGKRANGKCGISIMLFQPQEKESEE